jgi:hypothetical protein
LLCSIPGTKPFRQSLLRQILDAQYRADRDHEQALSEQRSGSTAPGRTAACALACDTEDMTEPDGDESPGSKVNTSLPATHSNQRENVLQFLPHPAAKSFSLRDGWTPSREIE